MRSSVGDTPFELSPTAKGGEQLIINNMKKLLEKIQDKLRGLKENSLRRQARNKMIKSYEQTYQGEIILEQWIIKKILDGKVERRKELAQKQAAIKETAEFINYLKNLKI